MKLKELKMYPAPISDSIFLGTMKVVKDKKISMWSNKIDFTEQFWNCLAEICRKKLIKSENNSVVFLEEFESGLKLEIKVSI